MVLVLLVWFNYAWDMALGMHQYRQHLIRMETRARETRTRESEILDTEPAKRSNKKVADRDSLYSFKSRDSHSP